jgi:anti-sigma regulatory factor (Ser/Thr protein kinase)
MSGGEAVTAGRTGDGPAGDPQVLHWHLNSSAAALSRMRHELDIALGLRGMSDDAHESVLLVAYELAANAVEHVGGPVDVIATLSAGSVRIEVSDGSPAAPQLRPHDPLAMRGRGLQVVDGLASRWSWSAQGGRKTVWADVPTDRPAERL